MYSSVLLDGFRKGRWVEWWHLRVYTFSCVLLEYVESGVMTLEWCTGVCSWKVGRGGVKWWYLQVAQQCVFGGSRGLEWWHLMSVQQCAHGELRGWNGGI